MAEAAALAVTGRLVAPLISKLVLKGLSIFKDGMKGKLENLQTITLPQIKQVIEKAEMLGREDDKQLMMVWLRELQDAAYEADNVLDEYDYELLQRQAKGKSSLSFLSDSSFRSDLKDSLEKLDKIASRVQTFTSMLGVSNASSPDDETTYSNFVTGSEPIEPQIFGRDKERDDILALLINNHDDHDDHLQMQMDVPVLPIVGVGGVGKTTLAQYIYNNPEIIKQFPQRMWIHTPQNFDEIVITRRMVESVHQDACPTIDNFATLQQRLQEGLQNKRFLLVLDDVWYDEKQSEFVNRERWRKLLAPLRHSVQGSVVLITSRIDLVAMTFGNALQPIRLEGLNEHDCLSLFNRYAFEAAAACGQQRPDFQNDHHHLMEIGRNIARKIVSKLGGLPLAAKVLGGMLRNKHDVEEWNKVLRINIWGDITRVLALSYKRMPPLLRQCVAHHGLYPKGFSFSGNYLVRAWIAEGFISAAQHDEQESGDQSMEEIGSNCLKELVFRSFLQRTHDGLFLLHDLMHDVADSVSRHECTRIQKGEKKKAIPTTTKHLCIHVEELDEYYMENICRLRNLRTLFFLCNPKSNFTLDHGVLNNILKKSKRLRTLDLAGLCIDKLPNSIGDLKHLRFLDLSKSTVKTLPKSFHKLYHLLYLDLSECKFDSMPKDLSELVNLRYLEAYGTTLSMIPNLGRLTALQELKEFHVKKKKGHDAGQLKNLANLRGTLRIVNLENINSTTSEANEAKLHDKKHLKQVWLEWDKRNTTSNSDSAEMVLDEFRPPPHITFLGVKQYVGSRPPFWMQPNNVLWGAALHTLVLDGCVNLTSLPPLGQLFPHLRELRLKDCYLIRYLPYLPPNLITLELHHAESLALLTEEELKLSCIDGPQLKKILDRSELLWGGQNPDRIVDVEEIIRVLESGNPVDNPSETILSNSINWVSFLKFKCIQEKLKMKLDAGNVQQLPSSLQHLDLFEISVDGATLSECLSRLHSLSSLKLESCMYITSLPPKEVLSNLKLLREIKVFGCKILNSLGGLAALASLEKLTISGCPNLMEVVTYDDRHDQSNAALLLPESLTDLTIEDCGFLDMGSCLMGLTRLSHLTLAKCQYMVSIPTVAKLIHLRSLQDLQIQECDRLVSVGGLHVLLSSLKILTVLKCPGLFTYLEAPLEGAQCSAGSGHRSCRHGTARRARAGQDRTSPMAQAEVPLFLECVGSPTFIEVRHQALDFPDISFDSWLTMGQAEAPLYRECVGSPTFVEHQGLDFPNNSFDSCRGVENHDLDVDVLPLPHSLSLDFCLVVDNLSLLPVLLFSEGLESLTSLAFGRSSQNTKFTREQEEWLQYLPSLRMLIFDKCERLPSLPSNLTSLTRLKHLHLLDCPQVSSLPSLPVSLEHLIIEKCHPELEQRCREGGLAPCLITHDRLACHLTRGQVLNLED